MLFFFLCLYYKKSKKELKATSVEKLNCHLNAGIFYYEIMKDTSKAVKIVKEGFDKAIEKLDELDDTNYKDATLIMQLLRDSWVLWENN